MAKVNVDRCPEHGRFRFNGICRECRAEQAESIGRPKQKAGEVSMTTLDKCCRAFIVTMGVNQ